MDFLAFAPSFVHQRFETFLHFDTSELNLHAQAWDWAAALLDRREAVEPSALSFSHLASYAPSDLAVSRMDEFEQFCSRPSVDDRPAPGVDQPGPGFVEPKWPAPAAHLHPIDKKFGRHVHGFSWFLA